MKCAKCGAEIKEGCIYCSVCGNAVQIVPDYSVLEDDYLRKKEFEYRLLEESGPEHDKTFVVEIDMEGECLGRGQGRTKKAAEQQAAYEALLLLRDRGYVFKKY